VRFICFVLIIFFTACKENTDTNNKHLADVNLSVETTSDLKNNAEFEQNTIDPQVGSQSELVPTGSIETSDKSEIEQPAGFGQLDVKPNFLAINSANISGIINIEQVSEIDQASIESDLPLVISNDVLDKIGIKKTSDVTQANIASDLQPVIVDIINVERISELIQTGVESDLLSDISTDVPDKIDIEEAIEFTQLEIGANSQSVNPSSSTVNLSLEGVQQNNQPPSAIDDLVSVSEDQFVLLNGLLINDQDLDYDDLKIVDFSLARSGFVEMVNDEVLKYIPSQDFNGQDTFSYTISDSNGGKSTAQVIVNVNNVNDIPIARSDYYIVAPSFTNTIDVIANDEGLGDGVKLSILEFPEYGSLELLNNNELFFTPNDDYFGLDNFVYQLVDSDGEMSIATVQLNIKCLRDCTRVFNLSWEPSISFGVAAYRVYVGKAVDQLHAIFDIGDITNFDYTANQKGEYFFAISAFNFEGIESELSEVIKGVF